MENVGLKATAQAKCMRPLRRMVVIAIGLVAVLEAPYESGMYIRWYADNIWLFVPVQQKLKAFLLTLPEFPFQEGSGLNAANINYTTLKGAAALKRLKELESLSPPSN